jgi:Tfp pilus assembly protein PilN
MSVETAPVPVSSPGLSGRLRSRFNELVELIPARQRTLIVAIGGGLLGCALLALSYVLYDRIDTLEEQNDSMQQALRKIDEKRDAYVAAKAHEQALESRIGQSPLQLSGFVEQLAKEVGLEIRETNPRSPEQLGKKYLQQSVDLRISKVGLEPMLRFLRRIETFQSNLVMVTELSVRARDDKHQDFEVDMTVSTFDHAPKVASKPGSSDGNPTDKESP